MTALLLGPDERNKLAVLRAYADENPMNVQLILQLTRSETGRRMHLKRMERFSVTIPAAFVVTYSIELGHPPGACRHLSVSICRPGRVPTPEAVWMLASELGFVHGLEHCAVWEEPIGEGDIAINVAQPVELPANGVQVVRE